MIITLDMVKDEVGRMDDMHDAMLQRKLSEGTAIVLDYLKVAADQYEDDNGDNDVPAIVGAAIISVTKMLYERPDDDPLTEGVKNILHRLRDPALA